MKTTFGRKHRRAPATRPQLAVLLVAAGAAPAGAQDLPTSTPRAPSPGEVVAARDPRLLVLNAGTFDPRMQRLVDPAIPARPREVRYSIVQFDGASRDAARAIRALGLGIAGFVPNAAYVVEAGESRWPALRALRGVRWVGAWQADFKLAAGVRAALAAPRTQQLLVVGFHGAGGEPLRALAALPGVDGRSAVLDTSGPAPTLRITVDGARMTDVVDALAHAADVAWIDRHETPELHNTLSVGPLQSGLPSGGAVPTPEAASIWRRGLTGTGQVVTVVDSGLDRNQAFFNRWRGPAGISTAITDAVSTVPPQPGPVHPDRKVYGYFVMPGASAYDDNLRCAGGGASVYHGTHTAGTVAGDSGTPASADEAHHDPNDGMAPHAQILFQDIGDDNTGCLTGVAGPDMFRQATRAGSWITSNSYGSGFAGSPVYNGYDASIDHVAWELESQLIVFSAGNEGPGPSIGHPGHAKNPLTVGATARGDSTQIAVFSSGGPTADGRRKPDLVAPGVGIVSAAGDDDDANPPLDPDSARAKVLSGTSMATPTVAGGAALLRQYFTEGWYPTGARNAADARKPLGAEMKAILLNGTSFIAGTPDMLYGWGRALLDGNLYFPGDPRDLRTFARPHSAGIAEGEAHTYRVEVAAGQEFRATLVWFDPAGLPGAARALVNDLDLEVSANGTLYRGNRFEGNGPTAASVPGGDADRVDPVEQVRILSPAAGVYEITVRGHAVPGNGLEGSDRQGYALAVSKAAQPTAVIAAPTAPTLAFQGADLVASVPPVAQAGGYQLYRADGTCATADPAAFQLVAHASGPDALRDPGTQGGYAYAYRVRAVDARGEGPLGACASVVSSAPCTLAPTFDGAPLVVTQPVAGDCTVQVGWREGASRCPTAPGVRYNVYRSTDPLFTPSPATRVAAGVTGTRFFDTGTQPQTTYTWVVRAEDGTQGNAGPGGGNLSAAVSQRVFTPVGVGSVPGTLLDRAEGVSHLVAEPPWSYSDLHAVSAPLSHRNAVRGASVYPENSCAALTTPPLRLGAGALLSYRARHDFEESWDGVVVELSADGGPWVDLPPAGGYPGSLSLTLDPPVNACRYPNTQGAFTGTSGGAFVARSTPLDAWAGREVRIRWRFTSDSSVEEAGFFLDDLSVTSATVPAACTVGGVVFAAGFEP